MLSLVIFNANVSAPNFGNNSVLTVIKITPSNPPCSRRSFAYKLTRPIPIYITYLTAWVDDKDVLNFRDDAYNHDFNKAV